MASRRSHMSAAALVLLASSGGALAHHSYAAFDMTKTVQVEATITKWQWTNPHAFLYARSQTPQGVQDWEIETTSPSMLSKRGFSRTALKPGDKIILTINPHRTTLGKGSLKSVKMSNGKLLSASDGAPPRGGAPR